MTYQPADISNDLEALLRMPAWVTSARPETPEDVAFLSGAALAYLHLVSRREDVPQALLRDRLALQAAEVCVASSGRIERADELRDEVHFLHPGDKPGPAGAIYLSWRRAVKWPVSVKAMHRALPTHAPEQIAIWLDGCVSCDGCGPLVRSAALLETVMAQAPREEATALILADAALAQAHGWDHVMPLLAAGLKRADLRKRGEALRLACHRGVTASAVEIVRMANDLARRAARLNAVAPKLRAKGAGVAVEMFLSQDAVTPAALASLNSDRAARRFCNRLVELGSIRELTGRDTFRLYGV